MFSWDRVCDVVLRAKAAGEPPTTNAFVVEVELVSRSSAQARKGDKEIAMVIQLCCCVAIL